DLVEAIVGRQDHLVLEGLVGLIEQPAALFAEQRLEFFELLGTQVGGHRTAVLSVGPTNRGDVGAGAYRLGRGQTSELRVAGRPAEAAIGRSPSSGGVRG